MSLLDRPESIKSPLASVSSVTAFLFGDMHGHMNSISWGYGFLSGVLSSVIVGSFRRRKVIDFRVVR